MKAFGCVLVLVGALAVAGTAAARPEFTIGSDPYQTVFSYPHDILRWPGEALYLEASPRSLPWQGNVTSIHSRPSDSYTSNYQDVTFATPSDYTGDPAAIRSYAKMSSAMKQNGYTLGAVKDTRYGRVLLELATTSLRMNLESAGVARAPNPGGSGYVTIPFAGETRADRDEYAIKLIGARQLFGNPFGFKVHYTRRAADRPEGFTRFTRDGTAYTVPHLTWGWATQSCAHIFGYSGSNVDAFYQDSYSVFRGRQWDFQTSYEHDGNWKSGLRYRTRREDGDAYGWVYDDGSEITGRYENDPYWKDRASARLLRAYTKARFFRQGGFDAGMLFLAALNADANTRVNKLVASDEGSREGRSGFVLEANPWFNYALSRGHVDFGLLCELDRMGMQNTETRWNDVSHSEQEDVLWSTQPYEGWSPYWERFSKGREWCLATGFEADAEVTVHRGWSALMRTTVLRKFTRVKKLYGTSEIPAGGNSYQFSQSHRRDDYRNEMWMTGAFGLSYRRGPATFYLVQDLPTAYLIRQTTKLADNERTLFEHEQRRMWQVQVPSGMRLFVVYELMP
ncbi:hypothetical protein FJ251_11030 [bacterium]|nr:hypothetical protein [bacterium]